MTDITLTPAWQKAVDTLRRAINRLEPDEACLAAALPHILAALAESVEPLTAEQAHALSGRRWDESALQSLNAVVISLLARIQALEASVSDYEDVLVDKRRLARELDVAMHGESGAAQQASLCDLIEPAKWLRAQRDTAIEALRKAEWSEAIPASWCGVCPACFSLKPDGHTDDCPIGRVLASQPAPRDSSAPGETDNG